MFRIWILVFAAFLSSTVFADAHSYKYSDHIVHGPFKNIIHKNSEIYFSASQDKNHPIYMIMSISNSSGCKKEFIIDKYDMAGSAPFIEALFFYDIKKDKNAVVIVSWEINSRGIGTYGKLYQIFSYKNKNGSIVSNDLIKLNPHMSGLDGYQDGERSEFRLKTVKDVKEFINKNLN